MTSSVSIIIPTYNGVNLLKEFIPKTIDTVKNSHTITEYEIIIVDDASTDDTLLYLNQLSVPHLTWLSNEQNSGFSKTINRGIQQATKEYTLLLNNDMEIAPDFFDQLIPHFTDEKIFGICSEIRDRKGETVIEGAKNPIYRHGKLHYTNDLTATNTYTLYLCGGNALVRTEKLKKLNGFNELFSPFYFEDFDLSLRAWRNGWTCLYSSDTYCKHCHSVTINKENKKEYVETVFNRNKLLLNYLHTDNFGTLKFYFSFIIKKLLCQLIPSPSHKKFLLVSDEWGKIKEKAAKEKVTNYRSLLPLNKVLNTYFNKH